MLIDFEWIIKKMFVQIAMWFGIEDDENKKIYTDKFKKIYWWMGDVGVPAFLSIVSVILLFWIFFRIYGRIGFEKTIITLFIILIVSVGNNKKNTPSIRKI